MITSYYKTLKLKFSKSEKMGRPRKEDAIDSF